MAINSDDLLRLLRSDNNVLLEEDGMLNLRSLSLTDYCLEDLAYLSECIATSNPECLAAEGVQGMDWMTILVSKSCRLKELVVTIRSQGALGDLVSALPYNNSLERLELEFIEEFPTTLSSDSNDFDFSGVHESINYNLLLVGIKPLQEVVVSGISPLSFPKSLQSPVKPGSWQFLTLEKCDVTHVADSWIAPSISSLRELTFTNCQISSDAILSLSESYLESSTTPGIHRKGKKTKRRRKPPLQFLNLSNNQWRSESIDNNVTQDLQQNAPSCLSALASWMDLLSNLVALDLSNNASLFKAGGTSMEDFCGTVNQSLRRLTLRNCGLEASDLSLLISTFRWIEALDLSENPGLLTDLSPLLNLDNLSEIVLECMIGQGTRRCKTAHNNVNQLTTFLQALEQVEFGIEHSLTSEHQQGWRPIELLNLSGNLLEYEAVRAISSMSSLKVVVLIGCQLESVGVKMLLEGMENKNRLLQWRELYLGSNNIGDDGVFALSSQLKNQTLASLRRLDLNSNTISMTALQHFIDDGIAHSHVLESVLLEGLGAVTSNQRSTWSDFMKRMEHYLSLNRAGRKVLFVDAGGVNPACKIQKIPRNVWPYLLEEADRAYGINALNYFLHKRPELVLARDSANGVVKTVSCAAANKQTSSPRSVMHVDFFA